MGNQIFINLQGDDLERAIAFTYLGLKSVDLDGKLKMVSGVLCDPRIHLKAAYLFRLLASKDTQRHDRVISRMIYHGLLSRNHSGTSGYLVCPAEWWESSWAVPR